MSKWLHPHLLTEEDFKSHNIHTIGPAFDDAVNRYNTAVANAHKAVERQRIMDENAADEAECLRQVQADPTPNKRGVR